VVSQPKQSEMLFGTTAFFYFMGRSGNVFSAEGLGEMCALHNSIVTHETATHGSYKNYCQLETYTFPNGTKVERCAAVTTPLALFYGNEFYNINDIDLAVFDTPNFGNMSQLFLQGEITQMYATYPPADVATVMTTMGTLFQWVFTGFRQPVNCKPSTLQDPAKVMSLFAKLGSIESLRFISSFSAGVFFDKNFGADNLQSKYTRAFYFFYGPICLDAARCYNNIYELTAEQENLWQQWWCQGTTSEVGGACEGVRNDYDEGRAPQKWVAVQPTPFCFKLLASELFGILLQDGIKILLPVVFTFSVVWIQVGSMMLAFAALFEMLASFFATFFVYSAVLQIKWMSFYGYLSLYIILAVGADDVFVFMDAWKQSFYLGAEVNSSLKMRMSYTYRRAGLAMLITSFTTAFAFYFAAIVSPIPTLQATCIFAGFVILIDYVLVMTWFTGFVVVYHNHLEMRPGLICSCCRPQGCEIMCDCSGKLDTTTTKAQKGEAETTALPPLRKFFNDTFPFNTCIKPKGARFAILAVFAVALVPLLIGVFRTEPSTTTIQFLPDWHPFQRFLNIGQEFGASQDDEVETMQVVWGLEAEGLDTSGSNMLFVKDAKNLSESDYGTVLYESTFAFDEAAQLHVQSACAKLRTYEDDVKVVFSDNGLNETMQVLCFVDAWQAWLDSGSGSGGEYGSFPVSAADAAMSLFHFVEENPTYGGDVIFGYESGALVVKGVVVRADSKILSNAFYPAPELRVFYASWEAIVDDINVGTPASLGDAWQACGTNVGARNLWIYMVRQETYIQMALQGVLAGLAIGFVVILVSTGNVIVSTIALLTIFLVIVSVLGTTTWIGWQLGDIESICLMILAGFAVDYVVHLAHAYMESGSYTRMERVGDALADLGISVFWGMTTSAAASIGLVLCLVQFFARFGLFLLLTIVYAYLWAAVFMMIVLALVGPVPKKEKMRDGISMEMEPAASA